MAQNELTKAFQNLEKAFLKATCSIKTAVKNLEEFRKEVNPNESEI